MRILKDAATGQRYAHRTDVCDADGHLFSCHPEFYDHAGVAGVVHPHGVFCRSEGCPRKAAELAPLASELYEYRVGYQYKDGVVGHTDSMDEQETAERLEKWRVMNGWMLLGKPWLERRRILKWERATPDCPNCHQPLNGHGLGCGGAGR